MSFWNKIRGKSDVEAYKEKINKDVNKKSKRSIDIAEYAALLETSKNTFERTIRIERLNALERREKRIGDASQKSRIHDAAVGLIAIENAEIELRSAAQAGDFADAKKKLGYVVRQINKLDPYTDISKKDIKEKMGLTFEDSNETEGFVERAEMVDEQFVEYLIQGYSMEECIAKKLPGQTVVDGGSFDFSSGNADADAAYIDDVLRKNADKR